MFLEILTPEKKLFSDTVYGVQLPGVDGSFEVLDKHASMVAALKKGTLKILINKTTSQGYAIASGFVEILANNVSVLVEGAEIL